MQAQLTAKSEKNQQLADKVAELEADVSRLKAESLKKLAGLQSRQDASLEHLRLSRAELEAMSAQTQARFERVTEQHAEVVQQLQQQRDREARVHSEEVTRLRALLEVAHAAKSHTPEVGMGGNMPCKEHHMQCAVTGWHHLSKMCCTCVLFCLWIQGAFDNRTHPCSDQKHQFDPAGRSKHILNSDIHLTCVMVLACSLQSCHCSSKGVQGVCQ
jgi:uncharacterized protein YdcH (DUF465 family)